MDFRYIEKNESGYQIIGSRVSLDSLVYAFWRGQTAESIAQSFPVLTLAQVYGALAYYLANKAEVDASIRNAETEFDKFNKATREADPMFYQKLAAARRQVA